MTKFNRLVLTVLDSPRRDFEWRLFLATRLARLGVSSAIGSKGAIKAIHARSKNAILLGRLTSAAGRSEHDLKWVSSFPATKTKWVFFHDEGGIFPKGVYDSNVKRGYPDKYFDDPCLSKILFWGEDQRVVYQDHHCAHKFEVVGSPRLDLIRPEYNALDVDNVDRLRRQYGRYTLICSRFAVANKVTDEPHPLNKRFREILVEANLADDPQSPEIIRQQFTKWNKTTHEFADFFSAVAELLLQNPESTFVIRPHPTERASLWQEAFGSFANAHIDKSSDVRPLIRASSLVIHSECTTGLEAAVNEKPTINFRPWRGSDDLSIAGVSEVGCACRSVDELIALHARMTGPDPLETWSDWAVVRNVVVNSDPQCRDATARIAEIILDVSGSMEGPTHILAPERPSARVLARRVMAHGRRMLNRIRVQAHSASNNVGGGDTKAYAYSPDVVTALWQSFGGHGSLSFDKNVVWVKAP